MATAAQVHISQKIFIGGSAGRHSFRVPSLVKAKNGDLVAFAECRKQSTSYFGDIDIVYRVSRTNGDSWGELREVVSFGNGSWTNPTAVVDYAGSGRIWLFMNWNAGTVAKASDIDTWGERKIYASRSDTNGSAWSLPEDMTNSLLPPDFTWDTIGPGNGIQLTISHPGWLVVPAYGRNIYSADKGATWKLQMLEGGRCESSIAELADGRLLRNDRPAASQEECRYLASGLIEGQFGAFAPCRSLPDPRCQGSMLRYNIGKPVNRLFSLNSASTKYRSKMTVSVSYDDGATWPVSRALTPVLASGGQSETRGGYSSLAKVGNQAKGYSVGALIEMTEAGGANYSIEFHRFNLQWILDGAKEPKLEEQSQTSPSNPAYTPTVTPVITPP